MCASAETSAPASRTLAPLHANAVYVLELSSYQLDLVKSLHCDVAVLMNITPDHLDRHGGMEGYTGCEDAHFPEPDRARCRCHRV